MTGLEYILHLYEMQHQELSENLNIAKQNVNRWIKETRPIPKKYLPILSKMFNIPEEIFQKQLNEDDKIEIQKLKIRNDMKNSRQETKKPVKSFEDMTEDELVEAMKQEQEESIQKLYIALDSLKGKSVLADTAGGFNTFHYYEWFSWNLFKTSNGILKITLENDLSYDTETPPITFKVDEINTDRLIIDDNLNDDGTLDEDEAEYYVENIIIELENSDKLRLELQW